MKLRLNEYTLATLLLGGFALWFGFDLYTQRRYLNHPEYVHYYFSFRQWFLHRLMSGEFPIWNPYWGLGHTSEIEASFPVDIYSLLEIAFGPKYSSFQLVQLFFVMGAGLFSFTRMGFSPLVAAAGTLLFFMSPWVTYFFFYFIKTNSFIGLLLSISFAIRLKEKRDSMSVFLLAVATAFTLFGTKVDFWFFHCVFLGILGLVLRTDLKLHFGSLLLGIACHAWQIVSLVQILRATDRLGDPPGLTGTLLFNFVYSVASSSVIKTLVLVTLCLRGKWGVIFAGILFVLIRAWAQPPFSLVLHPFFIGGIAGLLFTRNIKSLLYFLPLSLYWCRPLPGDLNELTVLNQAPRLFPFLSGFLVMCGLRDWKSFRIWYLVILILFLFRDQGQVLMAHLFGMVWIPSRDNFLFDACFAVLAMHGLSQLPYPKVASTVAALGVILSAAPNFYYSHPLIAKTPSGFPFYDGVPEIRKVLKQLPKSPTTRVYFMGPEFAKDLPMFGASLLEGVAQVHEFSSFIPKRYHDWTAFQWFGFRPEDHWSSYEGEYTEKTIQKLPPRNTKGMPTNQVYWWALHAMPPPQWNALRLLGVNYVISSNPSSIQKVSGSLPRAFWIEPSEGKFEEALDVRVSLDEIAVGETKRKIHLVEIEDYQPERITLQVDAPTEVDLILSDLYHPFWRAKIDGEETKIRPAFSLFRMIRVPAGKHQIEYTASIPYWTTAWTISVFSLMVLLGLSVKLLLFFRTNALYRF